LSLSGRHRYGIAEGFEPRRRSERVQGDWLTVMRHVSAVHFDGEVPSFVWSSLELGDDWEGPPVRIGFWT
jgi:hypothetical protein